VRQRTDGDGSIGEDACAILQSREDPTVIPRPIPSDDSTQRAQQEVRAPTADETRLMAELSIIRGRRHYFYDGYSYDRLSDAIAYAQLVRGQPHPPGPSSPAQLESSESPTASDWQLMRELSISFEYGRFVFEGFRYDRLADAANYARHCRRPSAATHQQ
jgi:hypothetical protein